MPTAIPYIVYAIATYAGATALTVAVLTLLATLATSYYLDQQRREKAAAARRESLWGSLRDRENNFAAINAPHSFIYGKNVKVGGAFYPIGTSGANNEYFHYIIILSGREISAINKVFIGDSEVLLDGSGNANAGRFLKTGSTPYSETITTDASGNAVLSRVPNYVPGTGLSIGKTSEGEYIAVTGFTVAGANISGLPTNTLCTFAWAEVTTQSLVSVRKYTGAAGQVADPVLTAAFPAQWTAACVGAGVAYLAVRILYDPDVFAAGVENTSSVVDGHKVFDPRTSLTALSDNPALAVRDLFTASQLGNRLASKVNDASVIAAANACEELVAVYSTGNMQFVNGSTVVTCMSGQDLTGRAAPGMTIYDAGNTAYGIVSVADNGASLVINFPYVGTTSSQAYSIKDKRYRANGVFGADQDVMSVMGEIADAMAGWANVQGGKLYVKSGVFDASLVTFSEDDVIDSGAIEVNSSVPLQRAFNAVKGVFIDPARNYLAAAFSPVKNASYAAIDGGQLFADLGDLHWTSSNNAAQRLGKVFLERARTGVVVSAWFNYKAYSYTPGDVVQLNWPTYGWSNKTFRITERTFTTDKGIRFTLVAETAAVYAWNQGEETVYSPAGNTALPNPLTVSPPSGIVLDSTEAQLIKLRDGTLIERIKFSWEPSTDVNVLNGGSIEVEAHPMGSPLTNNTYDIKAQPANASEGYLYIDGVRGGVTYRLRSRYVNNLGMRSAWAYLAATHKVVGKTSAPPPPTALSVTRLADGAREFSITLPAALPLDIDHAEIALVEGNSASYAAMTIMSSARNIPVQQTAQGTVIKWQLADPAAGIWSFGCRLLDTSGNSSAAVFASNQLLGAVPQSALQNANLCKNSDFIEWTGTNAGAAALRYWSWGVAQVGLLDTINRQFSSFWNPGIGGAYGTGTSNIGSNYFSDLNQDILISAGVVYEFSVRTSAHRCRQDFIVQFFDINNIVLSTIFIDSQNPGAWITANTAGNINNALLMWGTAQAPAGATKVRLYLRKYATNLGETSSFAFWNRVMVCVAPPGVTAATATPWSEAGTDSVTGAGIDPGTITSTQLDPLTNATLTRVAQFDADNLLTPLEKQTLVLDYNIIINEQPSLDTQATNYGITTEKTAYDTAVTNLTNYLATLTTPTLWSNLAGDTTTTGTTLRTNFQNVCVARTALLTAIDVIAGQRATAAGLTGQIVTSQIGSGAVTTGQIGSQSATIVISTQPVPSSWSTYPWSGPTSLNLVPFANLSWTNTTGEAVQIELFWFVRNDWAPASSGYVVGTIINSSIAVPPVLNLSYTTNADYTGSSTGIVAAGATFTASLNIGFRVPSGTGFAGGVYSYTGVTLKANVIRR